METKYKEPAVKTPTTAQLTEIASQLGFDLGPAEIQEYKGINCLFLMKWIQNATRLRSTTFISEVIPLLRLESRENFQVQLVIDRNLFGFSMISISRYVLIGKLRDTNLCVRVRVP